MTDATAASTTASILTSVALPAATAAAGLFSYACYQAAAYLSAKTKNEFISRVVGAAGRVAGDISDKLAALPPGSNYQQIRDTAVQIGVADVKARVGDAVKKTGVDDASLAGVISGELGKLNALSPTPNPLQGSAVAPPTNGSVLSDADIRRLAQAVVKLPPTP
jgi:hypothetical protein